MILLSRASLAQRTACPFPRVRRVLFPVSDDTEVGRLELASVDPTDARKAYRPGLVGQFDVRNLRTVRTLGEFSLSTAMTRERASLPVGKPWRRLSLRPGSRMAGFRHQGRRGGGGGRRGGMGSRPWITDSASRRKMSISTSSQEKSVPGLGL